jgi:hypothetical protein
VIGQTVSTTKSPVSLAPAEWAWSTRRSIPDWTGPSRSNSCLPNQRNRGAGRRDAAAFAGGAAEDGVGGGGDRTGKRKPIPQGHRPLLGDAVGEPSPQAGSRSDSIYECFPLQCPSCGQPMRIIAFILDPPVIERILGHVGEPTERLAILPARSPPQGELAFDQDGDRDDWPEMDQSVDTRGDPWD